MKIVIKKTIFFLFLLSVIVGIGLFFHKNIGIVNGFDWGRFSFAFFCLAVGFYCLVNLISFFAWRGIYRAFNGRGTFRGGLSFGITQCLASIQCWL